MMWFEWSAHCHCGGCCGPKSGLLDRADAATCRIPEAEVWSVNEGDAEGILQGFMSRVKILTAQSRYRPLETYQ